MVAKRSSLAEYSANAVDGCSHVEALSSALGLSADLDPKEVRDMVIGSGMERGAALSYDRLEEVAAAMARNRE
jgi:hypothetical protein